LGEATLNGSVTFLHEAIRLLTLIAWGQNASTVAQASMTAPGPKPATLIGF
jgi:hypothetical protein